MSTPPAAPEHFKLTTTGLVIEGSPTLDECLTYGEQLFYFVGMAPLVIADLYLYTSAHDEAKAASMVPAIGRTKHTLQNWLSIARAFPHSRRREGLEMGHYDAVSGIKTKDGFPNFAAQDAMIEKAASEGWPISKARDEAAKANEAGKRKALVQPNDGPAQIEATEGEEGDEEDSGPVFGKSAFGEAMTSEERADRLDAIRSTDLRDTNQNLLTALAKVESFGNADGFIRELNVASLNPSRIKAAATFFAELAREVEAAQRKAASRLNSYAPRSGNPPRDGGHGVNQSPDEVGADRGAFGIHAPQSEQPADLTHVEPEGQSARNAALPPTEDDLEIPVFLRRAPGESPTPS